MELFTEKDTEPGKQVLAKTKRIFPEADTEGTAHDPL